MKRKSPSHERKFLESRIDDFEGDITRLEKAVGMYFVGMQYGWKVLLLVHDKKTIRQYEKILNIDIRQEFPERGPLSERSRALKIADKVGNFWKVVRGGVKGGRSPDVTS